VYSFLQRLNDEYWVPDAESETVKKEQKKLVFDRSKTIVSLTSVRRTEPSIETYWRPDRWYASECVAPHALPCETKPVTRASLVQTEHSNRLTSVELKYWYCTLLELSAQYRNSSYQWTLLSFNFTVVDDGPRSLLIRLLYEFSELPLVIERRFFTSMCCFDRHRALIVVAWFECSCWKSWTIACIHTVTCSYLPFESFLQEMSTPCLYDQFWCSSRVTANERYLHICKILLLTWTV
jgi:hypothetical protein